MLQTVCENCVRLLEEKKNRQLRVFVILWKMWKKLAHSSINQSVKTNKKSAYSREYCCCARKWHVIFNNWTFWRHHWDEFCIKKLVWRHTKFSWFRSWSQLTIQCVFASLNGPAIDLQKMPKLAKKKIIFSDEVHFDLGAYINKKNCRIRVTENPHAYIEKPTHPKRLIVWYGFWCRD